MTTEELLGSTSTEIEEEIIFQEILPRLPIKSIFRFKSVCKKWLNSLTHDPLFASKHHHMNVTSSSSSSPSCFLFCPRSALFISSSDSDGDGLFQWSSKPSFIPVEPRGSGFMVLGCCNGLIYGLCSKSSTNPRDIFICNPITKHAHFLPNPNNHSELAFASDHLGYTIIALHVYRRHIGFEIYSSKTNQWRSPKINGSNSSKFRICNETFLRTIQSVYTGGRDSKVYLSLVRRIMWFDFANDAAGFIQCPDPSDLVFLHADAHFFYTEIGVCDGKLSYSKMTVNGDIEIWLLRDEEDDKGIQQFPWVKKHTLCLQTIVEQNWDVMSLICQEMNIEERNTVAETFASCRCVNPLPYSGGENVWFTVSVIPHRMVKVFLINLKTRELKLINRDFEIDFPFFPIIPTLLPLPTLGSTA